MNLRGRTIEPLQRLKPEAKSTKNKPRRRSVRNKSLGKDDNKLSSSKTTLHKESPKEIRPRTKRRYSRKAGKKTTQADMASKPYFPPVEETGIREVIEQFRLLSPEDCHLASEAFVIYECRTCHDFFRALGGYLKHKQSTCTSLAERSEAPPENRNPFAMNEICSLYEDNTDLIHDCISRYCPGGFPNSSGSGLTIFEFMKQLNLMPVAARNFDPQMSPQILRNNLSQNISPQAEAVVPDPNHSKYPVNSHEKTTSSLKGSRLLVPVAARSFNADMEPKINSFQSSSEFEENCTNLPTSEGFQSDLPEMAKTKFQIEPQEMQVTMCTYTNKSFENFSNVERTYVPCIEAQKSANSPVKKISKPIIQIEDESSNSSVDFMGFESPKSTEHRSIFPRLEEEAIVTCSSTLPIKREYITCDNSSYDNTDIIEISFPAINDDNGISLTNELTTPKKVPITKKNRSSSTSARSSGNKYPTFNVDGDNINMKIEPDSYSYNEGKNKPSKNNIKRTSTSSFQESESKKRGTQYIKQEIKKEFVCKICNSSFERGSDFRYHKRDQHLNFILGFKCPLCNIYLLNLAKLSFHVSHKHNEMGKRFGNFGIQHEVLHIADPRICRI